MSPATSRPIRHSLPALAALLGLLASALVSGCFDDDPHGSEVENEIGIGRLYLSDGSPAPYAKVRLFKVDDIPDGKASPKRSADALSTRTDAKGRYSVRSLPAGEYNILADLDGAYAYQDSLVLSPDAGSIPPDTLADPAAVSGYVGVQPQHDPRTVTVQILGTHRYANVDADGRFEFKDLAGGEYSLRLVTTLPDYTPTFASLSAISGQTTRLADTLKLIYTGIPAVTCLRAAYDTVRSLVTLSWKPVSFRNLKEYVIFRDTLPVRVPTTVPAGTVTDTTVADRVRFDSAAPSLRLRYSVKVRDQAQVLGSAFGSVEVGAAPPALVTTRLAFRTPKDTGRTFTVGDSVRISLEFSNPTRKTRAVVWTPAGTTDTLARHAFDARSGRDTLTLAAGSALGSRRLVVTAIDEAGMAWTDSLRLEIVDDRPGPRPEGPHTLLRVGDRIDLKGSAADNGRIVKWEWSLGPETYRTVARPDTSFDAPMLAYPDGSFSCRLRATDEDGNVGVDSVGLTLLPFQGRRSMLSSRVLFAAVAAGGKIYAAGGRDELGRTLDTFEAYDPDTDTWSSLAPMPTARGGLSVVALGGKVYALGGFTAWSWTNRDVRVYTGVVEVYDPILNTWDSLPRLPNPRAFFGVAALGGKIHVFEGVSNASEDNLVVEYDTATGSWTAPYLTGQFKPRSRYGCATTVVDDRIYLLGGMGVNVGAVNGGLAEYRPATGMAEFWPEAPYQGLFFSAVTTGSHIRTFGGFLTAAGVDRARITELDPASRTISTKSSLFQPTTGHITVQVGGRIYLIGGYQADENGVPTVVTRSVELYDPAWDR